MLSSPSPPLPQVSAQQFTSCNSSLGTKSLVFADCRGSSRVVTDVIEEASGNEIANIISYKEGETYYFTSESSFHSSTVFQAIDWNLAISKKLLHCSSQLLTRVRQCLL